MIIKWEVGDFEGTIAAIDSRWQPVHPAVAADQHIGVVGHIKLAINAADVKYKEQKKLMPNFITKTPP